MAKKRANHTAAGQIKGGGQAEASTKVMQRVAVGAFSAAAGAAAFRAVADFHALDGLLAAGACGNSSITGMTVAILGHCVDCYAAGSVVALSVFLVLTRMATVSGARAGGLAALARPLP